MAIFTRTRMIWLLSLLMLVLEFMIMSGAQEARAEGLQVTVLLYSGRPNPVFTLDDKASIDTIKDLVGKSKARESFKKKTVLPSILGYNGIIVQNIDGKVKQFPQSLIIYNGVMEATNKRKTFLNDEGGKIESYLLNKALEKKVIDRNAIQKIKGGKGA